MLPDCHVASLLAINEEGHDEARPTLSVGALLSSGDGPTLSVGALLSLGDGPTLSVGFPQCVEVDWDCFVTPPRNEETKTFIMIDSEALRRLWRRPNFSGGGGG
jgi:hypothetical protein